MGTRDESLFDIDPFFENSEEDEESADGSLEAGSNHEIPEALKKLGERIVLKKSVS
jgi:hypothetical protein